MLKPLAMTDQAQQFSNIPHPIETLLQSTTFIHLKHKFASLMKSGCVPISNLNTFRGGPHKCDIAKALIIDMVN